MGGQVPPHPGLLNGDLWCDGDAVGRLRHGCQRRIGDPVEGRFQQCRTRDRQPLKKFPGGIGGPDGLGDHAVDRPGVQRRFDRKVVAPVTVSPAAMAACTGAAPRQAGSSEKCRLTQPCSGTASSRSLSSAPYATTAQHSGASSVSSPMNSSELGLLGRNTGMSCSAAYRATGDGDGFPRRPEAASGRVSTATTS